MPFETPLSLPNPGKDNLSARLPETERQRCLKSFPGQTGEIKVQNPFQRPRLNHLFLLNQTRG
jgi:hypothetical protein